MSSSYDNVVGGGLKLKGAGGDLLAVGKKKKKKKNKKRKREEAEEDAQGSDVEGNEAKKSKADQNLEKEQELAEQANTGGEMTLAEKAFELAKQKRAKKRVDKAVSMTHRERMEAFNLHLGSLSEHMDIPKVGPG